MALISTNKRVLKEVLSVCPECITRVNAAYTEHGDNSVWLEKNCPQHGIFAVPIWDSKQDFIKWTQPNTPQLPVLPSKPQDKLCPYDCGLCVNHQQATCCVLLEVTSRCDLNCPVCFASSNASGCDVPLQQISEWYDMLLAHGGPFNIQLSGGEPTMRDDLAELIRLGRDKGFSFFQLNTNGLRISRDPKYLQALADAGLNTVFLQFDSLQSAANRALRGRDVISDKIQAIQNCGKFGLGVVLVPTVCRNINDDQLGEILRFAASQMPVVRGVHFQPLAFFGRVSGLERKSSHITIPQLLNDIQQQTDGALQRTDFLPAGAEHPLCSFHASYTVRGNHWSLQQMEKGSCCCGGSDAARKKVAQQWSASPQREISACCCGTDTSTLDAFLTDYQSHTLAISGMAFQDVWSLDLERLCRCYIHVVSPKGTLIPFCSYNLTAADGTPLHRK